MCARGSIRKKARDVSEISTRTSGLACIGLILSALGAAGTVLAAEKPRIDYGRDVRPILAESCFHCHGQDSRKRMASLRLDSFEGALRITEAVLPLCRESRKQAAQEARKMPPAYSNRTL